MEKKELTNGIVEIEGVKTVAERTVDGYEVTYKPHGNYHKGLDVNEVVYDLMIIAAHDMLDWGTTVYAGEYTAAEMAGKVGYLHQFMEGEDYKTIGIKTETFCCSYHAGEAFAQMAEWEGVMNMAPKKYHRFAVEGKEMPEGAKLKPYQRCHGYKPRTISLAAENDRIAKKFEVIGKMAQSLTSEGMKRALSVLTAVKSIEKLHGREMGDLAGKMLRRKLWRDYGKDKYQQPMVYTAKDFEPGPECWKVVDEDYAKELIAYFRQVLAESPAPKWPAKGDMVMLKNQEKQCKKWQGKLSVYEVRGQLDMYQDKINWYAVVCTTKGKHDSTTYKVDALEPWTEPEKAASKRGKNDACIGSSERKQARPEVKSKKKAVSKKEKTTAKAINLEPCTVNPEPTLEERLRAALRKQLAMAA